MFESNVVYTTGVNIIKSIPLIELFDYSMLNIVYLSGLLNLLIILLNLISHSSNYNFHVVHRGNSCNTHYFQVDNLIFPLFI